MRASPSLQPRRRSKRPTRARAALHGARPSPAHGRNAAGAGAATPSL